MPKVISGVQPLDETTKWAIDRIVAPAYERAEREGKDLPKRISPTKFYRQKLIALGTQNKFLAQRVLDLEEVIKNLELGKDQLRQQLEAIQQQKTALRKARRQVARKKACRR